MYKLPAHPPSSLAQNELVQMLLPEAIAVLENDFRTSGIDADLIRENFSTVFLLRDRIASLVAQKAAAGSEPFFRLLYRADVPETKLKKIFSENENVPFETVIAEQLVIRALQRVYFRKKYGK